MTVETLKTQILDAITRYCGDDAEAAASMLSGMSLTATFLAKLDGDKVITPQVVASVVAEVGSKLGFQIGRLKP